MVGTRSNSALSPVENVKSAGKRDRQPKRPKKVQAGKASQVDPLESTSKTCGKSKTNSNDNSTTAISSKSKQNKDENVFNEELIAIKKRPKARPVVVRKIPQISTEIAQRKTRNSLKNHVVPEEKPRITVQKNKNPRSARIIQESSSTSQSPESHIQKSEVKFTRLRGKIIHDGESDEPTKVPTSTNEKLLKIPSHNRIKKSAPESTSILTKISSETVKDNLDVNKKYLSNLLVANPTGRVTRSTSIMSQLLTQLPPKSRKPRNKKAAVTISEDVQEFSPIKSLKEKNLRKNLDLVTSTPQYISHTSDCDKSPDQKASSTRTKFVMSPSVVLMDIISSPKQKKLRQREPKNYTESSLEKSTRIEVVSKTEGDKVPIYKRPLLQDNGGKPPEIQKQKVGDLYDFDDFNSPEHKNRKIKKNTKAKKATGKKTLKTTKLNYPRDAAQYQKTVEKILQIVLRKAKKNKPEKFLKLVNLDNNNQKGKSLKPILDHNAEQVAQNVMEIIQDVIEKDNTEQVDPPAPKGICEEIVTTSQNFEEVSHNDLDDYFGFEPDKSPRVKILHNIRLDCIDELNLTNNFNALKPNANSTMNSISLKPWRFDDITVHRHPYYLSLKPSALPCLRQEMILDHTIVDKFDENCHNHTLGRTPPRKSPVQTAVTEFFACGTDVDDHNKENPEGRLSLYDEHALSPLKRHVIETPTTPVAVASPKRKILVPVLENLAIVPESLQRNENVDKIMPTERQSKRIQSNFGFDSITTDNEDDEREPEPTQKPFRFLKGIADRQYPVVLKPKVNKQPVAVEVLESSREEDDVDSETESVGKQFGIFDDLEETGDLTQNHPLKKRRKAKWLRQNESVKKRRKDVRSLEEEEKAEKWAESFNAMCAEVEKFPLEVE